MVIIINPKFKKPIMTMMARICENCDDVPIKHNLILGKTNRLHGCVM